MSAAYYGGRPQYKTLEQRVGEQITEMVKSQGVTIKNLAAQLANILSLSQSTMAAYLANLQRGALYGTTSKNARTPEKLYRLTITLHLLKVDAGHSVVRAIRQLEPKFKYPLTELPLEMKILFLPPKF